MVQGEFHAQYCATMVIRFPKCSYSFMVPNWHLENHLIEGGTLRRYKGVRKELRGSKVVFMVAIEIPGPSGFLKGIIYGVKLTSWTSREIMGLIMSKRGPRGFSGHTCNPLARMQLLLNWTKISIPNSFQKQGGPLSVTDKQADRNTEIQFSV